MIETLLVLQVATEKGCIRSLDMTDMADGMSQSMTTDGQIATVVAAVPTGALTLVKTTMEGVIDQPSLWPEYLCQDKQKIPEINKGNEGIHLLMLSPINMTESLYE